MGNQYEVWSWERINDDEFMYCAKYAGNNFDEAMRIMKEEKESGIGCVKLEWRS